MKNIYLSLQLSYSDIKQDLSLFWQMLYTHVAQACRICDLLLYMIHPPNLMEKVTAKQFCPVTHQVHIH